MGGTHILSSPAAAGEHTISPFFAPSIIAVFFFAYSIHHRRLLLRLLHPSSPSSSSLTPSWSSSPSSSSASDAAVASTATDTHTPDPDEVDSGLLVAPFVHYRRSLWYEHARVDVPNFDLAILNMAVTYDVKIRENQKKKGNFCLRFIRND